jgi:predicted HicB family RNase H-like nuclease
MGNNCRNGRRDAVYMLNHKGYIGKVEFDDETGILAGEVVNTRAVITFQGTTVQELREAFKDSVEDYLEFCAELGEEPEKPCSGQLVLNLTPELHREITLAATREKKILHTWISEQLAQAAQSVVWSSVKRPAKMEVASFTSTNSA